MASYQGIENYTYNDLFVPGKWYSDAEKERRSALINQPKPLNPNLSSIDDPRPYTEDPDAVGAVYLAQVTQDAADIVDNYTKMQEEALADIGVYEWDVDSAHEEALSILEPYFTRELDELKSDIKEKRLTSQEDFDQRLTEIKNNAKIELKKIDITEAKNEQDLTARLDAIGGREEYEKAEQSRLIAQSAEELQTQLADVRGRAEYLTDEQRTSIADEEEKYRTRVADIEGSAEYNEATKRKLIDEARKKLDINLRDITGQEEFAVEAENRTIRQVQENLERKIGDIGSRKEYSYKKAQREWETRIAKEEEAQLGRGRGYSGVMREEMGRLYSSKEADLGEILRRYGVEEEEARTKAEFATEKAESGITEARRRAGIERETAGLEEKSTRERAKLDIGEIQRRTGVSLDEAERMYRYAKGSAEAAIGEIERSRGVSEERALTGEKYARLGAESRIGEIGRSAEVERGKAQQDYAFTAERAKAAREAVEMVKGQETTSAETGLERSKRAYGEGEDYGLYGGQRIGEVERKQKEAELAQVNKILEQRREEHSMAREVALGKLPSYEEYYSREKAKRTPYKYTL